MGQLGIEGPFLAWRGMVKKILLELIEQDQQRGTGALARDAQIMRQVARWRSRLRNQICGKWRNGIPNCDSETQLRIFFPGVEIHHDKLRRAKRCEVLCR